MIFLRYIGSGSFMYISGQLHNVSRASAWRSIHRTMRQLCNLRAQVIKFPPLDQFEAISRRFKAKKNFPNVIGCIDGSQIPIFVLKSDIRETYSSSIYAKLQAANFNGYHILGDSAYPLSMFCMTPYRNETAREERNYNYRHSATRMNVEKLFGQLKRRFPLLSYGLRFKKIKDSANCILACFILHNICIANGDDFPQLNDEIEDNSQDFEEIAEDENVQNAQSKAKRDSIKAYLSNV